MSKSIEQIMQELAEPMPYKWRVQSFSKNKPQATCVAYVDSRDVQNRLDQVLGADCWQSDYKQVKNNMFAGIGVRFTYEDGTSEWIWKWDCGTESNTEKEKGEASDSFKRAAVKFGVGRFLYDLEMQYVDANEPNAQGKYPFPVDASGKKIWDLTKHINGLIEAKNKAQAKPQQAPPKQAATQPQPVPKADFSNTELLAEYNELLKDLTPQQQAKLKLPADADAEKIKAGIKYLNNMIETKKNIKAQTVNTK